MIVDGLMGCGSVVQRERLHYVPVLIANCLLSIRCSKQSCHAHTPLTHTQSGIGTSQNLVSNSVDQ